MRTGIIAIGASLLAFVLITNGLTAAINPLWWIGQRWALHPGYRREDYQRASSRFGLRILGAIEAAAGAFILKIVFTVIVPIGFVQW